MRRYDCIVAGTGAVGSAALYHLARRGLRVLGIDRFAPPHARGSSHGRTRIIRLAYFEHPDYVPLLRRAYVLWRDLEAETGERLFVRAGLLEVGPPNGVVVPGVLESARRHGLEVERLEPEDLAADLPAVRVPPGFVALYEPEAGYLRVEAGVRAHLERARALGAETCFGEAIASWTARGGEVVVQTARSAFAARRLIIAAGPWAATLLPELSRHLRVVRKASFWFAADDPALEATRCPCFFYELPQGQFYGVPAIDADGIKVAEHTGGRPVADPLEVDRAIDPSELERVQRFVAAHLSVVSPRLTHHEVCLYTRSEDEHFIVDRHPLHPQVVFAAGLSGHGYKFAPALGEALADLAEGIPSRASLSGFSLRRLRAEG
ncbi:MAG: N-methyl-L-tryptophan oxidase [Planctomycetota bacterium]|nr:MAG: N-methyl-L-tryptophan oxidase [Planctomycetota bacterium]